MAQVHIPSQAQLIAPQVECDCIDSTHGKVLSGTTAWEAYVALTSETPKIFALALRARNAVARLLKAEAISGFAEKNPDRAPKADDEVDFFQVVGVNNSQLVLMTENDDRAVMLSLDITCLAAGAPPTQLDVTLSGQAYSKTGHFQIFFMNVFYGIVMKQMLANIKGYQKQHPPKPKAEKKFDDPLAGL